MAGGLWLIATFGVCILTLSTDLRLLNASLLLGGAGALLFLSTAAVFAWAKPPATMRGFARIARLVFLAACLPVFPAIVHGMWTIAAAQNSSALPSPAWCCLVALIPIMVFSFGLYLREVATILGDEATRDKVDPYLWLVAGGIGLGIWSAVGAQASEFDLLVVLVPISFGAFFTACALILRLPYHLQSYIRHARGGNVPTGAATK